MLSIKCNGDTNKNYNFSWVDNFFKQKTLMAQIIYNITRDRKKPRTGAKTRDTRKYFQFLFDAIKCANTFMTTTP